MAEEDSELKQPIPPDHSLAGLFADLEIDNFLDGSPVGYYGLDWGHIRLSNLDAFVRSTIYAHRTTSLLRTTKRPMISRICEGKVISMVRSDMGEVEQPWVTLAGGAHYIFSEARPSKEGFFVRTRVTTLEGELSEHEYSVPQLRERLGLPIPVISR